MTEARKAVVEQTADVIAYSELWHLSRLVLDYASDRMTWPFLVSPLLVAFAFEAYLNHVGEAVAAPGEGGRTFQWLEPEKKLDTLCGCLNLSLGPKGKRPYQTFRELFDFRNELVHGRTERLDRKARGVPLDRVQTHLSRRLKTKWQNQMHDDRFTATVRKDIEAIILALHNARPEPKEAPFTFGFGFQSAILPEEPGAAV